MIPLQIVQRDQKSEVDQLAKLLCQSGPVVGFGAGSRPHLAMLAGLGYDVTAADSFDVQLGHSFDSAVIMGEFGYLVGNKEIRAALGAVAAHLRPGGLLVFDVLDGESVLRAELPQRGLIEDPDTHVLCGHTSDLRTEEQVYELKLRTWQLDGDQVTRQSQETHVLRYFLPRELRLLLSVCGFTHAGTARFTDPRMDWLRLVSARKS